MVTDKVVKPLPVLAAALKRLLEELPSVVNGLSRFALWRSCHNHFSQWRPRLQTFQEGQMIFRLSDDMSKFRSEVRCYSAADIPVLAVFTIDKETADEIRELQKLVEVNKLFKVEKFDSRVCWYKGHTQTTVQDAMLNVSSEHFWFSAYVKHNRVEIMTELFLMWDLPYPNGDIKKSSNSIANCSLL